MKTIKTIVFISFLSLVMSCSEDLDYSISENIVGTNWKYYPSSTDDYFSEYYMLKFVSDSEVELWVKNLSNVSGGALYFEESKSYSITGNTIKYSWGSASSWTGSIKRNEITYYVGKASTGYTYTFYKK
ncbi:MAG: hypothetical protein ACOYMD_08060 [Paludibacter sp.]